MKQKSLELDKSMLANLNPKSANNQKIQKALEYLNEAADLLDIGGYDKEAAVVTDALTKIAEDLTK